MSARWTKEEVGLLESGLNEGMSIADLCELLGRSEGGVRSMITALGRGEVAIRKKKPVQANRLWTADEDVLLLDLWNNGWSRKRIARKLGRTAKAIGVRFSRLNVAQAGDKPVPASTKPAKTGKKVVARNKPLDAPVVQVFSLVRSSKMNRWSEDVKNWLSTLTDATRHGAGKEVNVELSLRVTRVDQ